jgi:hypothetical protein
MARQLNGDEPTVEDAGEVRKILEGDEGQEGTES